MFIGGDCALRSSGAPLKLHSISLCAVTVRSLGLFLPPCPSWTFFLVPFLGSSCLVLLLAPLDLPCREPQWCAFRDARKGGSGSWSRSFRADSVFSRTVDGTDWTVRLSRNRGSRGGRIAPGLVAGIAMAGRPRCRSGWGVSVTKLAHTASDPAQQPPRQIQPSFQLAHGRLADSTDTAAPVQLRVERRV